MKRKNGFTLIELLAVIVILAIIALIATPIIMNVIHEAKKGSAKDSMYGYVEAVELEVAKEMINNTKSFDGELNLTTKDGNLYQGDTKKLDVNFKGTIPNDGGTVTLTDGNVTNAVLNFGGYEVNYDGSVATVSGESNPTTPSTPTSEPTPDWALINATCSKEPFVFNDCSAILPANTSSGGSSNLLYITADFEANETYRIDIILDSTGYFEAINHNVTDTVSNRVISSGGFTQNENVYSITFTPTENATRVSIDHAGTCYLGNQGTPPTSDTHVFDVKVYKRN